MNASHIITERLVMDIPRVEDIPDIVALAGNAKISATTGNMPFPYAEKDAIYWINKAHQGRADKTNYIFAVRSRESDQLIGGIGLVMSKHSDRAEIGYWIGVPYWGQGFASEATRAILEFGFRELNLHKIFATHFEGNPASGRVMVKNGMTKEGTLREHYLKDGEYRHVTYYGILAREFFEGA